MLTCKDASHKQFWLVTARKCNYSAFNGYRWTPSDYSQVMCPNCNVSWRTKAGYVDALPNAGLKDQH